MSFDPSKPANNSPLSSAEMRTQLTSLDSDIQSRVTVSAMNTAINGAISSATASALSQSSNNSNSVATLGLTAQGFYDPTQFQQSLDKLDELITALRR